MNETESKNLANMQGWYNDMWGQCNAATIPQYTNAIYLRHDGSGPATPLTAEQYSQIAAMVVDGRSTADFKYHFIVEGDFVAAIGLLIFDDDLQWDWVQLFRLVGGKLAETWLPALGVKEPLGYPKPENSWADDAIHDQDQSNLSANKQLVKDWFDALAGGGDITPYLAPQSRWHDIHDRDLTLNPGEVQTRLSAMMQGDTARDMRLHLIEQGEYVVASGVWSLGDDGRRWNWVTAFQIRDDSISRVWWNAIGGTDASIEYGPDSDWHMDMMPEGCVRVGPGV